MGNIVIIYVHAFLLFFDYEKACFILKKREHKIASLNFASENILLAPIKALQLLISAA